MNYYTVQYTIQTVEFVYEIKEARHYSVILVIQSFWYIGICCLSLRLKNTFKHEPTIELAFKNTVHQMQTLSKACTKGAPFT